MPRGRPYVAAMSVLLLGAAPVVIAGCSPRTAVVVGAGGAALGAVSAAGSAAGSAIGSAGSAASNAVSSARGGTQPAADATAQVQGTTAAPPAPTARTFRSGIADCLDTLGTADVASTLVSDGWTAGSDAAAEGRDRQIGFVQDGVRGSVVGGRSCSFAAEALAGPTGRALAFDALQEHVGSAVTPVAPTAQRAPCGGYAFNLDGQPARMDFMAAPGGDCSGAGAGVTISLI